MLSTIIQTFALKQLPSTPMPEHIPFIRIFVSSPGDVNDERKIALDVIEQLPYRPTFREKVAFRVIAWDKPGAGTPMRATLTPQDAINKGLPTPSECDIVVVLFWSRMGTPFIHTDGMEYQSGTHWELLNAIEAKRPETVIYRRTDEPPFKVSDADFDKKHAQYKAVQDFFKSDLFYAADDKIKRGINMYKTPDDFRRAFEIDLEVLVLDILNRMDAHVPTDSHLKDDENVTTIQTLAWDARKSPFPGLHAFKEEDAPIFFGRGYETDALVKQLNDSRFVAVVGASGSGKSSLVGAGLIPRLRANAIEGSKDWQIVRFIPGEDPIERLYDALLDIFPQFKPNPLEARRIKQNFIADMREAPQTLLDICITGLENLPEWAQVLLFVDQFEELFTLSKPDDAKSFAVMLDAIAKSARLRVVVTMRADFYHRAVEYPQLAELLRTGSFPLAIPKRDALRQMIERPAERAGLTFDHALVERILNDTGDEPGNLALMAYALDELYKLDDDKTLTHHEYEQLGGVQGAIGTRAENQFMALGMDENVIQQVFHALVEVDERGTATRRREQFQAGSLPDDVRRLIKAFTDARLLTTNYDITNKMAIVEVAHEAILRSWPRLTEWIEDTQDDLRLLRQVRNAAEEWDKKDRPDYLLWPQERLKLVYTMQARLNPDLNEVEQAFIEPEQNRLLREIETLPRDETSHERRRDIGDRLAVIGDTRAGVGVVDGMPDIVWLSVEVSPDPVTIKTDEVEIGPIIIPPLFIAQYQITYAQFQTFLDADDGFADDRWWDGMPDEYKRQEMARQRTKISNAPRDSVSWYQCVAFARWLNQRLHGLELRHSSGEVLRIGENAEIRLPTEWEWQWTAQNGVEGRAYPFGDWQEGYASTSEAGLNRTTAVGMYPYGAADCGALDMAGNLFDWCQNDRSDHQIIDGYNNGESKVLRGGSFDLDQNLAAASARFNDDPRRRYSLVGLRLVVSAPISAL
jgi:formylglycine-generating enzyme required for sulfatase activity/energy-coupling factor transporter ATP-binding protein EcfA2